MKENICFQSLEIFGEIFKFGIINILSWIILCLCPKGYLAGTLAAKTRLW